MAGRPKFRVSDPTGWNRANGCQNGCQTQKRHPFLDASLTNDLRMVPRVRIELTTCGLGNRRSIP